jgi:ABC-type sugar transport system ATPase subunit
VFPALSSRDNLVVPHVRALARHGLRRSAVELSEFEWIAGRLRVNPPRPNIAIATLSGGNAQKVVVGRWLARCANAVLLMLDEPTQGIDVGARADLYRLLREFVRESGRAVLFASSDVEEVVALADKYLVLHRGRPVAQGMVDDNEAELVAYAHGATGHAHV